MIDGDLRRGSTSAYIDSPETGLSNYLVGEVNNIKDITVCDTLIKGLCVIPVGTIPPNPTELLETKRFAELIEKVKDEYDYILVDCPPVEMMADAQIIETLVDRTIFVIRAGLFERSMLPELQNLYDEKNIATCQLCSMPQWPKVHAEATNTVMATAMDMETIRITHQINNRLTHIYRVRI